MYPSLAAAKAAVLAVGEEIATLGLPSGISPIVFVFTGDGNGTFNSITISVLQTFVFYCSHLRLSCVCNIIDKRTIKIINILFYLSLF